MGTTEPEAQSKLEKASSPVQETTNIHAYPNWAAIQAYYGPGVTLPPPYFNSAVTSGHPPHAFMWGTPQPMLSPYGTPYPAIYSHGGVYAHPSFPPGSNSQGHGNPSSPTVSEAVAVTPLSIATPAKSSSNKDQGLMKKLKGLNGLAVSIGNGNSGSSAASHSGECRTEGSCDGGDENTSEGGDQMQRKSSEGKLSTGKDGKGDVKAFPAFGGEASVTSNMSLGVNVASAGVTDKTAKNEPSNVKAKTIATTLSAPLSAEPPAHDSLASGLWIKDERELKREKRKQSNRESARRSRLRKQAETEELAMKVETLSAENLTLRSEINQLKENSEKMRLENAALMEKLKGIQVEEEEEMVSNSMETDGTKPVSTENFLSRVDNPLSNIRGTTKENEIHENSNSGAKLHQLLESNPRADAVAAG